jgi:signal transduction histidine kinase
MNRKKIYTQLLFFVLFAILGIICGVLSKFYEDNMPVRRFANRLHIKENIAQTKLQILKNQIITAKKNNAEIIDAIDLKIDKNDDIFFYVIENENLIYWSGNQIDIKSLDFSMLKNNTLAEMSNALCVPKTDTLDNLKLLALIKIKNIYGVDNKYIASGFAKGFSLDDKIEIASEPAENSAIYASNGEYLFSLLETQAVHHNKVLYYIYVIFIFVAFIFYGILFYNLEKYFGKNIFELKKFTLSAMVFAAIPLLFLFFKIPKSLYETRIFSPIIYSDISPSLGHLLVITMLAFFIIFTLYFKVFFEIKNKISFAVFFQIFFVVFFMLIIRIITSIIYNSTLEIFTFSLQNNDFFSVLALLIVVLWFLMFCYSYGKFIKDIKQFMSFRLIFLINIAFSLLFCLILFLFKNPNFFLISFSYFLLISLIFLFINLGKNKFLLVYLSALCYFISIFIVYYTTENQQNNQYKNAEVVAENLVSEVAIISASFLDREFLSDLGNNILSDKNIENFIPKEPNKDFTYKNRLLHYIKKKYSNYDFPDIYNLNVVIIPRFSQEIETYNSMIFSKFKSITQNFYYNIQQNQQFTYIGIFNFFDSAEPFYLILEIEKKINESASYEYRDEIFDNKSNNISHKFSSALYKKNNLVYENGYFQYPAEYNFKIENKKYNSVSSANYIHYIFNYNDDLQIVVSFRQMRDAYILNFTYIFTIFVILILIISLIFKKNADKNKSITDNLQKAFAGIMFFVLFVVVLSIAYFTYREYKNSQKRDLEIKMKYISVDLKNYFNNNQKNINDFFDNYGVNTNDFVNILSRKYDADIQLYNTYGELIATSRPYIFANGFVSSLINSNYFFEKKQTNTMKIENIGSLSYFSIYNALLDADKNVIAYLEVPKFFSMEQLRSETILYIATIANIFFLILNFSILLNFWLSRRITLSISKIEKSLKSIAVGGKNLKMEIKQNGKMDEIEKLMLQYNLMVDELDKNTRILLENERNFAWRDMAKQIAHEIKNPLTPMKLSIQQLKRIKEVKPKEFDTYFNNMSSILIEQIDNLSKIASSFSNFAKVQTENLKKTDINQKLCSAVELFRNNTKNIEIIYDKPPQPIFIMADSEQIIEVFNNIFRNAIQAIPLERNGKIIVTLTENDKNVLISISDNGCGISEEVENRIFMPNFSTKNSGTGLGLSIVKHIVEVSNGKIWFSSKINEGTTFYIQFLTK